MKYIICYNNVINMYILALRIKCCKGLIVYHKVNGLTTMKNDIDVKHKAIYVKHSKEAFKHSKGPFK
jgi:hypothetical protein